MTMPRSSREIIEHADELAKRFEDYTPRIEDQRDPDVLLELRRAVLARSEAERSVQEAVQGARAARYSWRLIGSVLGTSGEAARQRYAPDNVQQTARSTDHPGTDGRAGAAMTSSVFEEQPPARRLSELLAELSVAQVADALTTSPQVALALRRGHQALTAEQADILAPLVGHAAADLIAANPTLPVELERALDAPQGRQQVLEFARTRGLPTSDARTELGYAVLKLAARQSGGGSPAWAERIDRYMHAVLHE
jgi:hypothetical protein